MTGHGLRQPRDDLHDRLSLEQRQPVANVAVFGSIPQGFYAAGAAAE